MHRRSVLLLALAPAMAGAQPAPNPSPNRSHWLVGRWEGKVTAGIGREGPDRVLIVRSVAADGKVRGSWTFNGTGGNNDDMKLDGETLEVRSGRGNSYRLHRANPDRLEGDYVPVTGRNHPGAIWLARVP